MPELNPLLIGGLVAVLLLGGLLALQIFGGGPDAPSEEDAPPAGTPGPVPGPVAGDRVLEIMLEELRAHLPDRPVEIVSEDELQITGGAEPIKFFLHNLRANTRDADDDEIRERARAHVASILSTHADEPDDVIAQLVPVVKDDAWVEEARGMGMEVAVHGPLASGLQIIYAVDSPESLRFLTAAEVPGLELQEGALFERALENLRTRLPDAEFRGDDSLRMVTCGGDFEASLLAFDRMWDDMADEGEGDLAALLLARDLLFILRGTPDEIREKAQGLIEKIQSEEVAYQLGPALMRRSGGRWNAME